MPSTPHNIVAHYAHLAECRQREENAATVAQILAKAESLTK